MMEKIKELLKNFQPENIAELLSRLSERERYIVFGSAIGISVLIIIIIITSSLASLHRMEKKIARLESDLKKMESIRGRFIDIEREIERLEGIIKRTGKNFSITTYLEKLAEENNIKITSVSEKTAPPNDLYKERLVEVNLRRIYLKNLVEFLYQIENSPQLLRIKSLQIRPNYSNPMYLNVIFNVSTFEPVE